MAISRWGDPTNDLAGCARVSERTPTAQTINTVILSLVALHKKCRFCKKNNASSREHILARSRLHRINQFRPDNLKNDNYRKKFRGITCKKCNSELGRYEELQWSSLAYATIWKILVGNTNDVFRSIPVFLLKHTNNSCREAHENLILNVIKSKKILPENTFGFDIVYTGTSNEKGEINFKVLRQFEMINVVTEESVIKNFETKIEIKKPIDVIIYVSYGNNHRIIVILPLVCRSKDTKLTISHKGFQVIIKKTFSKSKGR